MKLLNIVILLFTVGVAQAEEPIGQLDYEVLVNALTEEGIASVTIPAGSFVQVLDEEQAQDGSHWLRLGVDHEDVMIDESIEHDFWILAEEYMLFELSQWRMTYCYRFVKKYLLSHGLVKVYLPGGSAYQAAGILPKYGFKRVGRKPSQAITNDVCVYKGGPAGHGHIEVMTAKGWYYGYGYKKSSIKNRTLISCFHK